MKHTTKKFRPAVRWPGGKFYTARWIVELMVEPEIYVEPYAGGLSVLLNKEPSPVEVISDTNSNLINLYNVIKDPFLYSRWHSMISGINYSEAVFDLAKIMLPEGHTGQPSVQEAVFFTIKHRFSRGGYGESFAMSTRLRGKANPLPGDINAWETMKQHTGLIHDRLKNVITHNDSALNVMAKYAGPTTVYYLDPPYPQNVRVAKNIYGKNEMSLEQHKEMLDFILKLDAKAIYLSTYHNKLYEDALKPAGWGCTFKDVPNHSGQGKSKQRRQEVVWFRI